MRKEDKDEKEERKPQVSDEGKQYLAHIHSLVHSVCKLSAYCVLRVVVTDRETYTSAEQGGKN